MHKKITDGVAAVEKIHITYKYLYNSYADCFVIFDNFYIKSWLVFHWISNHFLLFFLKEKY